MEVFNFIEEEDQAALDSEEKVFDEHVNRVPNIIEGLDKLEDLVATSIPTFFNRKILSWKSLWEQFGATIDSKAGLEMTSRN